MVRTLCGGFLYQIDFPSGNLGAVLATGELMQELGEDEPGKNKLIVEYRAMWNIRE